VKFRRRKGPATKTAQPLVCSSCNSEIAPDWTACRICGSVITGGMTHAAPPPTRQSFKDNLNAVMNGVNNESRGVWGPERYSPEDGQP
jgi:hypothetical protein